MEKIISAILKFNVDLNSDTIEQNFSRRQLENQLPPYSSHNATFFKISNQWLNLPVIYSTTALLKLQTNLSYTQYQKPVSKHMMEVLSMIDTILVGKQIASLRKAKGLTQNQLGERLNISFQAVSKWGTWGITR